VTGGVGRNGRGLRDLVDQ